MLKRGNVLSPEFTTAVQQVVRQHLSSFQPRPRLARKRRGGGGGEAENLTKFAVVTDTAGAATHGEFSGITVGSTGKAVLLEADAATGNLLPEVVLNNVAPGYDSQKVTDAKIEFKSLHQVACRVGRIVILHGAKIEAGSTFANAAVYGQLLEVPDYLFELVGFEEFTSLAAPAGADKPEDIQWLGGKCSDAP